MSEARLIDCWSGNRRFNHRKEAVAVAASLQSPDHPVASVVHQQDVRFNQINRMLPTSAMAAGQRPSAAAADCFYIFNGSVAAAAAAAVTLNNTTKHSSQCGTVIHNDGSQ